MHFTMLLPPDAEYRLGEQPLIFLQAEFFSRPLEPLDLSGVKAPQPDLQLPRPQNTYIGANPFNNPLPEFILFVLSDVAMHQLPPLEGQGRS
jgi:hypothetical protein